MVVYCWAEGWNLFTCHRHSFSQDCVVWELFWMNGYFDQSNLRIQVKHTVLQSKEALMYGNASNLAKQIFGTTEGQFCEIPCAQTVDHQRLSCCQMIGV